MDHHKKPFDEGTIAKLEIFEDYAQAWIPVFLMMKDVKEIAIFDFFSGVGYDIDGVAGSPIRLLSKIKEQIGLIFQTKTKIHLHLNEFEPNKISQPKFEKLRESCLEYLINNKDVGRAIEIHYHNKDAEQLFYELLPIIKKVPSLIYFDQNGVKFLSDSILLELEKLNQTDFLYFISSSYFKRFHTEFNAMLGIDMEIVKTQPYRLIHRVVVEKLKSIFPKNTNLKIYPYSIKKPTNPSIYGILFGAKHPRAVDKFLSISWKKNSINGDANFDIDDDINNKISFDLFEGKKTTKIEKFQSNLRERILNSEITDNKSALNYTYSEGHIPSHASDLLKDLKKNKIIEYDSISPLVTYDNVYKNKKFLEYKLLKK